MLANLVIVFFFISGNEPNTSDYTELVKTTSSESTNNISNLFNNKNEGCFEWRGERKRRKGNKFHNVIKLLREGR